MVEYIVSEYTASGMGDIDPRKYKDPKKLAEDVVRHLDRSAAINDLNKNALPGEKRGITHLDIRAVDLNGLTRSLNQAETAAINGAIQSVRENAEAGQKIAAVKPRVSPSPRP